MTENIKQNKKPLIIESSSDPSQELGNDSEKDSKNESNTSQSLPASELDLETEQFDCDYNLEEESKTLDCNNENYYSNKCNKFILKKELIERNCSLEETPFLYPNLNDKNFNIKIAEKKEFNDTKYDGKIHSNIKEYADILSKAEFELSPHQAFVKNFMSSQTPYNSLLLYHGLGSGKTCSAIGVSEEMRDYLKQMGISRRIIIVASENVQDNFKLQLFDERKLKLVDGLWNIKACTGNKLLKEINPMNMKGIPRDKVISQIKGLINNSYLFLGYGQFANYIIKTIHYDEEEDFGNPKFKKGETKKPGEKSKIQTLKESNVILTSKMKKRLRNEFDGRLIIIDEVHNIRKADDNENKKVAINLELLVNVAKNMRLLFLSATPMYNSYKEIIWLLNVMNINDRRGKIEVKDVFDKFGDFKKNGEDLLIRKATGYISFVRGENPYTFPYRVYPDQFAIDHTFLEQKYPNYQMNGKKIKNEDKKRIINLYLNTIPDCKSCGVCQGCAYRYIIYNLRNKSLNITTKKGIVREMPSFENMESFGYTLLQIPLESLIISYPSEELKQIIKSLPKNTYSDELADELSHNIDSKNEDNTQKNEIIQSELTNKTLTEGDETEEDITNKTLTEGDETEEDITNKTLVESSTTSKGGVKSPLQRETYIDPHELTGRRGLERMMNFVDSKSPPEKGSYEYKKSIRDKYGNIFSKDLIGQFSSKIKCILNNIVSEDGHITDGIILIYSQYIDSGLIPMALALEELGFTRFGKDVKPLFKNRPTDVVDIRTMRPPTNKKDFMPARYSMITGDPRLSPNNDFEVKELTNDNKQNGNITGNKIKIVLISKAGSEGIDLKFIRQVHILEPWYNMNRVDQIIGRAVRNFSHKELPFEKRNVQIFMYGTLFEDNQEEAADLYIYRIAEYKAIQIGKVSRVLKETAVDCIVNHDQTNFTQELMNSNLEEEITQELSNGKIINDFKIGDAPFSSACDYMSSCNYLCKPDKKIDDSNLNEDTYNEYFITINSEKILQKIRMLMKEAFFYKKDVLIDLIQTPKVYPFVQIYSALTQLIEDSNEFITDKYGRTGHLINIGEYYLFQPSELRDPHISIFDRSVPIDYKHNMIKFEINQDIVKPVIDKRNIVEDQEVINIQNKKLVDELLLNFNTTIQFTKEPRVPRGDDDWYKHCGIVMKKMAKDKSIPLENLLEFLVDHIIETLLFTEKLDIMNYLYSLRNIKKNSFEWFAKKYFDKNSIVTKQMTGFVLYNLNKIQVAILNKNNIWTIAEPEDEREIMESGKAEQMLNINKANYNRIIGFIGYEKNNKYFIFKTKDMESKRDTGARCDESGKIKTLETLNTIIGENTYTKETTKLIKDTNGNVLQEAIGQIELCVLQEFMLRYNNLSNKNNKIWVLTPEMAIFNKIYTVNVK